MADLGILGLCQELDITNLVVSLSGNVFPLELICILLFSDSDDVAVELIVFLDEPLILFLEWDQSLLVQTFIMLLERQLILELLIALCGLQKILQQFFNQLRALLI